MGLALCASQDRSFVFAPLIACAAAAYINAANFMDGVDGISALHGLVSGVHFGVVGWLIHEPWLSGLGALVALVFTAFAPWNLSRARVFLGDVGSYLLGGLLAGCAVAAYFAGAGVLLAVAPLLPYLADTFTTLVRRAWRRERIFEAHRSHVYQELTGLGLSHLASASVVALASATCSAVAFFTRETMTVLAIPITIVVLSGYLLLPYKLRTRSTARADHR
jgi:UDP-N-acetylmuramyl pentapeptide phosphotransferase/UDP-N-acetylglucosamine-1-phosphate transferase